MNIRKGLEVLNPLFSVNKLINLTSQKVFLPFYHTISDRHLAHVSNLYPVRSKAMFERDIEYLCKYFEPVSIESLYNIVNQNKATPKPIFHLTFDDGLSEIYSIIAPILEKKGIPATFFVNTDFLDNRALFYRYKVSLILQKIKQHHKYNKEISTFLNIQSSNGKDIHYELCRLTFHNITTIELIADKLEISFSDYLLKEQPYLSSEEINTLLNKGFHIGSHSKSHPFFKHVDTEMQKNQAQESFYYLKEKFNIESRYFSFPFSDEGVSANFFNWMYEHQNCKLSFGTSGLKNDVNKYHLHRVPFDGTLKPAKNLIKSEYLYFLLKSLLNKNKINRA